MSEIAFEEYESMGVTPQQVYKRKGEHQEAVMVLSELLVSELEENDGSDEGRQEPVPAE